MTSPREGYLVSRDTNSKPPVWASRRRQVCFLLLLFAVFLFRLWYGTSVSLWPEDETQIYLIGLKFYTTHAWPFFGPDVGVPPSGISSVQTPGALQGLLVGVPFFVEPVPEAPYILAGLLSFLSLCFLAWYCTRRFPEIPRWITWTWLLTATWTLSVSTQVFNPSYVLSGSILFFIGFLELFRYTSRQLLPWRSAAFLMGLGLCWVMQFHMSWVALVPFVPAAFCFRDRQRECPAFASLAWLALGGLTVGVFLLPTYLKFGLFGATPNMMNFVTLDNVRNLKAPFVILVNVITRFLSFASFAVPGMLRDAVISRFALFRAHLWLVPVAILPVIVGFLQPAAMVLFWFKKHHAHKDWAAIKYLTLASVCLLYTLFLFSSRPPRSVMFNVFLPLAMIYSLYCWSQYLSRRGWQVFASIFLLSGIVVHLALGVHNRPTSWLHIHRGSAKTALDSKDYRILGERRIGSRY